MPAVVGDDVVSGEQADLARSAARVSTQRMCPVDEPAKEQVGEIGRIFQVGFQVGDDPLLGPVDGIGGKDRPAHQPGQQLQRQGKVLGANAQRGPGRARLQRTSHVLDGGGQLARRAVLGALLQEPAGQARDSRPRLAQPAGVNVEIERHNPGARPSLVDQAQTTIQPPARGR